MPDTCIRSLPGLRIQGQLQPQLQEQVSREGGVSLVLLNDHFPSDNLYRPYTCVVMILSTSYLFLKNRISSHFTFSLQTHTTIPLYQCGSSCVQITPTQNAPEEAPMKEL